MGGRTAHVVVCIVPGLCSRFDDWVTSGPLDETHRSAISQRRRASNKRHQADLGKTNKATCGVSGTPPWPSRTPWMVGEAKLCMLCRTGDASPHVLPSSWRT